MAEQVFTNCLIAGPVSVYVKDGRITRVRPLMIDERDFKPWTIDAGGKKYAQNSEIITVEQTDQFFRRGKAGLLEDRAEKDTDDQRNDEIQIVADYIRN